MSTPMPRFLTPQRRVAPQDTRPRLPSAPGPKPAVISREDTITELRAIYRLLGTGDILAAKARITTLGQNLQA